MRRARSVQFFRTLDDGTSVDTDLTPETVTGVLLEGNFCAEHEWGIKNLQQALGIPAWQHNHGRTDLWVHQMAVAFTADGGYPTWSEEPWTQRSLCLEPGGDTPDAMPTIFGASSHADTFTVRAPTAAHEAVRALLERYECDVIPTHVRDRRGRRRTNPQAKYVAPIRTLGAWSGHGFVIASRDELHKALLHRLGQAMRENDLVVMLHNPMNPFGSPGLTIAIASRIPRRVADTYQVEQEDGRALKAAADATGIVARLKAAGRQWSCLRPEWVTDRGDGRVRFWFVRRYEDRQAWAMEMGWATVPDLDAWIAGHGPLCEPAATSETTAAASA